MFRNPLRPHLLAASIPSGESLPAAFDMSRPGYLAAHRRHVNVDSADSTCEKVTALGGRARPAFDTMNHLRMAIRFPADKPVPVALMRTRVTVKSQSSESPHGFQEIGTPATANQEAAQLPLPDQVQAALTWLKSKSTKRDRENMVRFAISASNVFGVSMANMKILAKRLGRNHELAAALWDTGWYEARMLASMIDEPAQVTPAQMDRWCRDFDNWGICDTVCFCLFDRTPYAWRKVAQWGIRKEEFVKRTAFALLWSLSVHDKGAGDERFAQGLLLIERAAADERNFVKKAVNMALRAIGKRNPTLHTAAVKVARRLADSSDVAARWVGRNALQELTSSAVTRRLAARRRAAAQK